MTDDELTFLRASTKAFVDTDPVELEITRTYRDDDGAGGWVERDEVLPETRRVKIQPKSTTGNAPTRTAPNGQVLNITHELVGEWDVDIRRGDTFTWKGDTYDVAYVDESKDYVLFAEVIRGGA